MVCARNAIVNDWVTLAAGITVAEPACDATMVQVPAVRTEIVCPETVQTAVVEEVKVIGKLRDDVALMVGAEPPKVMLEALKVNVRLCVFFTANVRVTGVAFRNAPVFPAWDAVIEQFPFDTNVTMPVGVTVHTAAVVLANATGNLLEAEATS
jgi:hypothetical protein